MQIGFDITPLSVPQSGVGTYTLNLLTRLAACETDHLYPLYHRSIHAQSNIPSWLQSACEPKRSVNKTLWMQCLLPWELRHRHIQVAHFTNSVAPLLIQCPTVVTIHDMTLWLFPQHHYRRRLLAMRPFIPLVVRRAAAVITVSHSAKDDLVRLLGVPREKVHVVYEAPAAEFQPLPAGHPSLRRVRQQYGLPSRFLLYVGTIEPRKNLVRLLEAFARLRQRRKVPHHLLLVGSRGWKDSPVFEAIERLNLQSHVRFLDFVPIADLVALYNLADALAFPSLYEGFGLPVVEAMACGTPVITSSSGSLGEVAGDAACIVQPRDVESIARGLEQVLLDDGCQEMLRLRGLEHVAQFKWERAARETRAIYERVAG